jgi:four helix bundle protein
LKLWQRAKGFWSAINEILDRPGFQRDRKLKEQLSDAADSMVSNIAEGFEQPSDRAFTRFLYTSKASTAEARQRVRLAHERHYIEADELDRLDENGDEVARMTTGLIKYLMKSDRRDRGLGRNRLKRPADD